MQAMPDIPSKNVPAQLPMKVLRVLVVEDDDLIGMLLAELLGGMGHEVCAIEATEADAVAAAARCGPDLMIVDMRLEEGSGISAVEKIIRTGFIPHVFVSADPTGVQVQRLDAVILRKPFREADIAWAMQRALAAAASGEAKPP